MPTDFSFVTDEGWDALKPQFEKAEKKLREKVEKKEISEDQGRRLVDLMWDKYDHWASGKGMKEKENQTVLQKKEKKSERSASIEHEARIGRTQLIDILNAITDGTIQNPAVFQQALELNRIQEGEFFDLLARDVATYPQLYPRNLVSYYVEHFTDWGFGPEVQKVLEQGRGSAGPRPQPPTSYERPAAPAPAQAPAPAKAPAKAPEPAQDGETVEDLAPRQEGLPTEPQPWPRGVTVPSPSGKAPAYRWYVQYLAPGEKQVRASIAESLTKDEVHKFIYALQHQKFKLYQVKPLSQVYTEPGAAQPAPAAAKPAPAKPAPAAPSSAEIDEPDPSDPNKYVWLIRYRMKSGLENRLAPTLSGPEALATRKRFQSMGLTILEMKKMNIAPEASIVDDGDVRLAADESDKFKSGTPIIFTEDVNLEFDALSARGQIKKNMTGKIKKVEDNDYLIDIAGQYYRVPKLVAEHVMDVFSAQVVVDDKELEQAAPSEAPGAPAQPQAQGQTPGQNAGQEPAPQAEKTQMPAAKPTWQTPGQKPGQKPGKLPPGGAPKMPAGMAASRARVIVANVFDQDSIDRAQHGWQSVFLENVEDSIPGFFDMSEDEMFEALSEYAYMLDESETTPEPSWGKADTLAYGDNGLVLSYHSGLGYASLNQKAKDPDAGKGQLVRNPDGSPKVSQIEDRIVVADIEIEAMAMSNGMLAKSFANGATSGKGSHMFIDGDTIYSYGRHFPIATRGEDGTIYLTTKRYSVSTARHISEVRNALIRAGVEYVESDLFENGKVAIPKPEEIDARERQKAENEKADQLRQQKRRLREEKKLTQKRQTIPEEKAQDIAQVEDKNLDDKAYLEQHDESGRPIKYRVDRTLAPSTPEQTPSLSPEQWMSRIQDMEDQMLRETDPARRDRLRQRIERMRQAAVNMVFNREATLDFSVPLDEPVSMDNALADMGDLAELMKKKDQDRLKLKPDDLSHIEHRMPPSKASIQNQGFAELLLMIEKGGPGIPSEIGKRLYRADGVVVRHSA